MFPNVLFQLLGSVVIPALAPILQRGIDQAHATAPGQQLPPIASQVRNDPALIQEQIRNRVATDPSLQAEIAPKPWYQSKGIWGAIVAVVAPLIGLASGYTIDNDQQAFIVEVVSNLAAAVGGVLAFIGRKNATKEIA
jgi:hypothetical protein